MEFARTWGQMKSNRSEEMNYEKMSRAMRYHYGCERQGRKGHLAMVKEKRLYYKYVVMKIGFMVINHVFKCFLQCFLCMIFNNLLVEQYCSKPKSLATLKSSIMDMSVCEKVNVRQFLKI